MCGCSAAFQVPPTRHLETSTRFRIPRCKSAGSYPRKHLALLLFNRSLHSDWRRTYRECHWSGLKLHHRISPSAFQRDTSNTNPNQPYGSPIPPHSRMRVEFYAKRLLGHVSPLPPAASINSWNRRRGPNHGPVKSRTLDVGV